MFEIGELRSSASVMVLRSKAPSSPSQNGQKLGIDLAAAIHLNFCDLRGQPLRDRVFLQPPPNLRDGSYPSASMSILRRLYSLGKLMCIQFRSQ